MGPFEAPTSIDTQRFAQLSARSDIRPPPLVSRCGFHSLYRPQGAPARSKHLFFTLFSYTLQGREIPPNMTLFRPLGKDMAATAFR